MSTAVKLYAGTSGRKVWRADRSVFHINQQFQQFELGVYARMWPFGAVHGLDGFVLMATRAATKQHSIPSNPLGPANFFGQAEENKQKKE